MSTDFDDIKIVGFDEKAARKGEPGTVLMYLVLELSASAPYAWAEAFNVLWESNFYMMKRRAEVSGDRIEIYCVPDELEKHHLPELKKIVAKTNASYREFLAVGERAERVRAAEEEAEHAGLAAIKDRLKFD